MFVYRPPRPNDLIIVTDTRTRADSDLDYHQGLTEGGPHVLDSWPIGRKALGAEWRRTTRLALFEHSASPTRKQLQQARIHYLDFLTHLDGHVVFVLPTAPAGSGEAAATVGTEVWRVFESPDALAEMRGTLLSRSVGHVMPGYPLNRRAKQLHDWQQEVFLKRALAASQPSGLRPLDLCPRKCTQPNSLMVSMLEHMVGKAVAVDLEFIPNSQIVMAVGLATYDVGAVSIPWHGYEPGLGRQWEPALYQQCKGPVWFEAITTALRNVLASPTPKAAHNFVADVPRLEGLGFEVNGPLLDTYAAHAIAYPELRHGLQQACASMFPCRPWKSQWKPKAAKGLTRDDLEFWTCEPEGLRAYNADDAWHTCLLAEAIAPSVCFEWPRSLE